MRSPRLLARTMNARAGRAAIVLPLAGGLVLPLCLALNLTFNLPNNAAMAETLKGQVNESGEDDLSRPIVPMPAPVLAPAKPLEGTIQKEGKTPLEGQAEDEDGQLTGMTPGLGKDGALKGNAQEDDSALNAEDPDQDDKELMVQWDKWRNRLLWTIQSGVQESLNNPDDTMLRWDPKRNTVVTRFPLGTTSFFSCQVTPDRRIINLHLLHPSGFPNFDRAVLNVVKNLDGSAILKYPSRSHRKIVTQIAGIKTSESSQNQFFHFGDVERYRE